MVSERRLRVQAYLFLSRFTRAMTLGVRGVVADGDGGVLLIRHSYVPGWYLPGGGVEVGETMTDALIRELQEEAGIELTAPAELLGVYLNRSLSRRDHVALFRCDHWSRGDWQPDREILDAAFFPVDALPADTTAATARRIREVFDGAVPTGEW